MLKDSLLRSAICALFVFAAAAAHAHGPYGQRYKGFSNASLRGCYVTSAYGAVLPDPTNPGFQLPLGSLVRYCADGRGFVRVRATQNIAGACILEQEGSGDYEVARDGSVRAKATLTNLSAEGCESIQPPIEEGEDATFFIRLLIDRNGNQQLIGVGLETPDGRIPIVFQGEAVRQ